jgi:hypothetical protein
MTTLSGLAAVALSAGVVAGPRPPGSPLRSARRAAAHKLTIVEALSEAGGDVQPQGSGEDAGEDGPARAGAELREAFGELLRRAHSAGAIRDDVALAEVYALMIGASRATAHVPMDEPTRARVLALTLDALRPSSRP